MKEKPKEFDEHKMTGFFDRNTEFKGELSFKGAFRIDGRFHGKIESESMLVIGEEGKLEADVRVGYLVVNGEVKGTIQASSKVEIHNKGRVIGTIFTPKLVVEEGAYLEANCQTTDKMPPADPEISNLQEERS